MAWRGLGEEGALLVRWGWGRAASPPWVWAPPGAGLRAGGVGGLGGREGSARAVGAPAGASGLGEGGGGAGRARGGGAGLLGPAVHAAAPRVHEEIADGVELQAQLLGDGDLHLLGRPLVLLEDGDERAPLQVGEHQPLLLGLQRPLLLLVVLLPLAGCGRGRRGAGQGAQRERTSAAPPPPSAARPHPDTAALCGPRDGGEGTRHSTCGLFAPCRRGWKRRLINRSLGVRDKPR